MSISPTVWEEVAPLSMRILDPAHRAVLEAESGISPDIIAERGYYSLTRPQVMLLVQQEVVAPSVLRAEGWMGIPIWRPDGIKHGEVMRLFGGDAKFKYVWPTGTRLALDVHPLCLDDVTNPEIPVCITEGIKKADAILSAARREGIPLVVLAANGCEGWRSKISGSSIASPDFLDIVWSERKVYINSDSDYRTNNRVSSGWNGCATYLSSKTGEHRTQLLITPPAGPNKQGADDFLVAGGTLGDLLGHAQTPERALLDESGERIPLKLKSGKQLIREAGTSIPHLLHPLIPERSIVLVAGHSGTYKTWHLLGLGLDGSFGFPWLNHPDLKLEGGPFNTLYVNKEMSGVILGQRLKTLARNARYTDNPAWEDVVDEHLNFADEAALDLNVPEQRDRLEDAIIASGARLVVLDSLSMCWHGDENSAAEVGLFYAELRGIIERTGCSFVLLHHLLKPPNGGRSQREERLTQFSIRGSGQLIQQADAALLFQLYAPNMTAEAPDEKLVSMAHVKARTTLEMPAWVTRFSSNDGLFQSMEYLCRLSEAKAHAYVESGGDPNKLKAWIIESCLTMPAMHPGIGNPGFRFKQLVLMLQQDWKIPDKPAPAEETLRRHIKKLVEEGLLMVVEENQRHGNLYRLAEINVEDPTTTEVAPTPPTGVPSE